MAVGIAQSWRTAFETVDLKNTKALLGTAMPDQPTHIANRRRSMICGSDVSPFGFPGRDGRQRTKRRPKSWKCKTYLHVTPIEIMTGATGLEPATSGAFVWRFRSRYRLITPGLLLGSGDF